MGLEEDRCTGQQANLAFREQCLITFNAHQRLAYDTITACIEDDYIGSRIFVINAPEGCGKTYLLNGILAHIRGMRFKCIAAASSGIAATLLKGGRTAHSYFGIPIPVLNTSTCNVNLNTKLGKLLNESKLIIWDEAFMTHTYNILAVSRMLKNITNNDNFFGGKIVIFCGDPRQMLHEIPKASRSIVVSASLIKCPLIWDSARKLNLSINMRVIRNGNNPQSIQFAKFLLDFGENNPTIERIHNTDIIKIPNDLLIHNDLPNTPETLINVIFPNKFSGTIEYDSAILTPKNCGCHVINSIAIGKFSEESPIIHLYNADTVKNDDGTDNLSNSLYPTEFLLNVNGLPLHKLELKERALVMLLRNIDVNSGLCNGMTMKVISITTKLMNVQISNGSHIGDYASIPSIELSPSDSLLSFKLSRRQFPIKLCFAMTINKAQGQSINNLGV